MSLEARLKALIEATGPLPLSAWMTYCLHDPDAGYYATRPGLGRDFITAPETCQIFGELLGLWCAHEWQAIGAPVPATLCEMGPGRGVLMADLLRAVRSVPTFSNALNLHLLEASAALRAVQARALHGVKVNWITELESLPDGPTLIIANEFLDCLPMRQFRVVEGVWHETLIAVDKDGGFTLGLSPPLPDTLGLPLPEVGAIERQPALEGVVADLAARAATRPLRALFIDYGSSDGSPQDTLRAYRAGQQVSPLTVPGLADLTVDVDFTHFADLARAAGLSVAGPIPQGQFLMALGAQARLNALIEAQPDRAEALFEGADKLIAPHHMGARFKVMCLSSPGLSLPAGFESRSD